MSFKPFEMFVFFIFPFILARVCRWAYLDAPKLLRYIFFGGLGALALWLWWSSPTETVKSGVLTMFAIVGIPTLLIAWVWPWLVRLVVFPYKVFRRFFPKATANSAGLPEEQDKTL